MITMNYLFRQQDRQDYHDKNVKVRLSPASKSNSQFVQDFRQGKVQLIPAWDAEADAWTR